jgi:GTP pyrophosphokinase
MATSTLSSAQEFRQAYRKLLEATSAIRQPDDIKLIKRLMLEGSHQVSDGTSQGFNLKHSFDVATAVVQELGLGRTSVICSLLYESTLYSNLPSARIEELFGSQVKVITEGLVKVAELYQRSNAVQNENFRKLLMTLAQDLRVILIIIADRLCTMRSLSRFPREAQQTISAEVGYLYAPMAHRMGLYAIKSELEDLVMKFTNREMYSFIARKLNETKKTRDKYIREFIAPLKEMLENQGFNFEIKGRTKTIHSIYNKIKKSNVEFEQVYDLFAIRIILDCDIEQEKAECWRVYSLVTDRYQPNPSRMRDWISVPKSNGYESLHTTVFGPENKWVEVQIRTRRMDEVAEKGFAAHWKYKGIRAEQGMDEWLKNIREILDNPELNSIEFIDDFRLNLYDEEVFIFTPRGDLKRLRKGATVLDFAFDVHSEVGKRCVGAKVNQRNVPIKYVLRNGDQIEILTANHQEPKQDWLNIVVTSKAKTKLKQALKEIQYKQSEIGKELLERRLKNWKLELTDQLLHQLAKGFGYKNMHDFLCDVGNEKLSSIQIKEFINIQAKREQELLEQQRSSSAENFVPTSENQEYGGTDVLMIDKDLTNVDYKLAKCCNPIFGDPIFGFVAAGGGIKIHRMQCPNAPEMHSRFGYRIVKAQWTGSTAGSYIATFRVVGEDDIGIVTNISQIIGKEPSVKMRSVTVNSKESFFEGDVSVTVNNVEMLSSLMKKIKAIKGVHTVSRIDGYV